MTVFNIARSLLTVLTVSVILVLSSAEIAYSGKPAPPPPPPVEPDWEYIPEQGGWLDWNTGLVWGENAQDLFYSLAPEDEKEDVYMLGSWDFANTQVLPAYRNVTGFNDWRLPTAAELTDAAGKNYTDYAFPNGVNAWTYQVVTWTSDGSPKWRVLGDLVTGETSRTLQERSFINSTPVRRFFTP